MKIIRFVFGARTKYGVLENGVIHGIRGNPYAHFSGKDATFTLDGTEYVLDTVRLLSPCMPSKIVAVGGNYPVHIEEIKHMPGVPPNIARIPKVPPIFLKPPSAIVGPDNDIILPPPPARVEYEGELGVVIGKKAKNVTVETAKNYVLGYTCFNDVSERNSINEEGMPTRGKSFDTFAPIGPWIETDINDPDNLKLETYLNGKIRQSDNTANVFFKVAEVISFISGVMTLFPGDIIPTGSPGGTGVMKAGDVVEVKIDKIGTLRNFVTGLK